MAYDASNLSALTYANGFTLWHYKSPDPIGDVTQEGYFNEAASMLRAGDFLFTNANTGGAALTSGVLIVAKNASGVVDVVDITDFSAACRRASALAA